MWSPKSTCPPQPGQLVSGIRNDYIELSKLDGKGPTDYTEFLGRTREVTVTWGFVEMEPKNCRTRRNSKNSLGTNELMYYLALRMKRVWILFLAILNFKCVQC